MQRDCRISSGHSDEVAVRLGHVIQASQVLVVAVVGKVRDEDGKLERVDQALQRVRYRQQLLGLVHDQQNALFKQQRCEHANNVFGLHEVEELVEVALVGEGQLGDLGQRYLAAFEVCAAVDSVLGLGDLEDDREHVVLKQTVLKH